MLDFTPTKFDTAAGKERFYQHFIRFVESDFQEALFYNWFYRKLSMTFGHIAHYDKGGFYATFFSETEGKVRFLEATLQGGGYGDPAFTFSDVENALRAWVISKGLLDEYRNRLLAEEEAAERALLRRLKQKYEGEGAGKEDRDVVTARHRPPQPGG